MSGRRIRAVLRKELREYRRNGSIVAAMAIIPVIFMVQPSVVVFALPPSSAGSLAHGHLLLYLLGMPALVPAATASYAVVGERRQGTLEPVLTTPVRRAEFLLGKALASLVPAVLIAYGIFAFFLGAVWLLADPEVARALLQWPHVGTQVLLTPPVAAWSTVVCLAISARCADVRVAQQLGMLACLPTVAVTSLTAFGVIGHGGPALIALLLILVLAGWRVVTRAFDRERLLT